MWEPPPSGDGRNFGGGSKPGGIDPVLCSADIIAHSERLRHVVRMQSHSDLIVPRSQNRESSQVFPTIPSC